MNEERMKILTMLAEGKINAEEAEQLLSAAQEKESEMNLSGSNSSGKFIYVNVEPKNTPGGAKIGRVQVKVPFALIKAGFNIAGLIPKEAQNEINNELKQQGMNFDFSNFNPENIQDIMDSLEQLTVDVDNEDSVIRVFCR
ncbi:MAG: hypothetical protein PQJ47_00700 [Sphaerochaetaceae bacterium]|nr:hypothetical protein [Sphaerochaetaceae bacterium]